MYVVKLETIIARIMMSRLDYELKPLTTFECIKMYIQKVNEHLKGSKNKMIVYPNVYKSNKIDRNSAIRCDVIDNTIILKENVTQDQLKEIVEVLDINLMLIMLSEQVIFDSGILNV